MDQGANLYRHGDDLPKDVHPDGLEPVNPRESDLLLHADLKDAGLIDLAQRAARGEWNDFFGKHAMPQHHLRDTLKARLGRAEKKGDLDLARKITDILLCIPNGKYDGTKVESEEWGATTEGRETEQALASPKVQSALAELEKAMGTEQAQQKIAEIEKEYVKDVLS